MDQKALKIQSTWRGRRERKALKKRAISAIEIQRILRGFFAKRRFRREIEDFKELKHARKAQTARLQSIKTRENDLRLLARISPEQYFAYDKLRQNSAARTIQKTWRNIRLVELASGKATIEDMYAPEAKYQAYGFRTAKKHGGKAHDAMRRSHELALRKALEQDPFRDKIDALHKHLQAVYQDKADSKFSPRYEAKLDISPDEVTLGLDQLFQQLRVKALNREVEEDKAARVTSFGNYRSLLKQRQRMEILLNDYYVQKDASTFAQIERTRTLLSAQRLLQEMQHLPTLGEAAHIINHSKYSSDRKDSDASGSTKTEFMNSKRQEEVRKWLYAHPEDILRDDKTEDDDMGDGEDEYDYNRDEDQNDANNDQQQEHRQQHHRHQQQHRRRRNLRSHQRTQDYLREAISAHVQMLAQLTQAGWRTFLLPVSLSNPHRSDNNSATNDTDAKNKINTDKTTSHTSAVTKAVETSQYFVLSSLPRTSLHSSLHTPLHDLTHHLDNHNHQEAKHTGPHVHHHVASSKGQRLTSAEESLQWVSYCLHGLNNPLTSLETSPNAHPVLNTTSNTSATVLESTTAAPATTVLTPLQVQAQQQLHLPSHLRHLRQRVLHAALHPRHYLDTALTRLNRERHTIRLQAQRLTQRVTLQLKTQVLDTLHKGLIYGSKRQAYEAARVIQSYVRAYLTRRRVRYLLQQRRIERALQGLLQEVAQLETGQSLSSYNNNRSSHNGRVPPHAPPQDSLLSMLQQQAQRNSQSKGTYKPFFLPTPPHAPPPRAEAKDAPYTHPTPLHKRSQPQPQPPSQPTQRPSLSVVQPPHNHQFTPRASTSYTAANAISLPTTTSKSLFAPTPQLNQSIDPTQQRLWSTQQKADVAALQAAAASSTSAFASIGTPGGNYDMLLKMAQKANMTPLLPTNNHDHKQAKVQDTSPRIRSIFEDETSLRNNTHPKSNTTATNFSYEADAKLTPRQETPAYKRTSYLKPQTNSNISSNTTDAGSISSSTKAAPSSGHVSGNDPRLKLPSLSATSASTSSYAPDSARSTNSSAMLGNLTSRGGASSSGKTVQFATDTALSTTNTNTNPPDDTVPLRTPQSFLQAQRPVHTPLSSGGRSSAVGTAGGDMLSPFLGLPSRRVNPLDEEDDEDDGYGYISTPSLSRSLTESFGRVTEPSRQPQQPQQQNQQLRSPMRSPLR